ncbi:hypothetical protein C355_04134 [Cryptococcus neoformans Th84]|uniref:Uncharacterized protein n=1 Tax=Cryptococcus neoformans Tu259-1 TaxID=1230072 RepID=A0A854QDR2_CRYNE|nr:hypothetical protein C361_04634 [Cryptococcus neoformans var. grubii Tu259-1]OXG48194.1 hypothetical protein C355_04134 [Cryptococcus neoformans var. grubii Th84]OXG61303.1 hypothetical protein C351_04212 [Cryptococcus neoformans var. grubii c8]OXH28907.1 hypothetical protein J009_04248 [Cryptococcus neoformans var. grubii]OXH48933.1 hypothetical protein J004_04299 [Cryptococcus neoformans var. grubii]
MTAQRKRRYAPYLYYLTGGRSAKLLPFTVAPWPLTYMNSLLSLSSSFHSSVSVALAYASSDT